MPKIKTHRGAAKRFRKTATGKLRRGHTGASHMFTKKTTKRKRKLRKQTLVAKGFAKVLSQFLPS